MTISKTFASKEAILLTLQRLQVEVNLEETAENWVFTLLEKSDKTSSLFAQIKDTAIDIESHLLLEKQLGPIRKRLYDKAFAPLDKVLNH
jgi:hypothetical protein